MTRADLYSLLFIVTFILVTGGKWSTAALAAVTFLLVSNRR